MNIVRHLIIGWTLLALGCSNTPAFPVPSHAQQQPAESESEPRALHDDLCPELPDCHDIFGESGCPDNVISFAMGQAAISPHDRELLGRLAKEIQEHGRLRQLRLTGLYVQASESEALALTRAQAVRDLLVENGARPEVFQIATQASPHAALVTFGEPDCGLAWEGATPTLPWWDADWFCGDSGLSQPTGIPGADVACRRSDGTLDGRITFWLTDPYYDGHYVNGQREGRWLIWRKGFGTTARIFHEGKLVGREHLWEEPTCGLSATSDCDMDGRPDIDDFCPEDAEDLDGYLDDDGCPDPDIDDACDVAFPCVPGG